MAVRPEYLGDPARIAIARELRESGAFHPRRVRTVGPGENGVRLSSKDGLTETRSNDPTRNPLPAAPIPSRSVVGKHPGR